MRELLRLGTGRTGLFIFWSALLLGLGGLFWLHARGPLMLDEAVHVPQILRFAGGDYHWDTGLAMTPGYHALMAVVARATGSQSLERLRLISFLGGALRLVFFYLLAARFWPEARYLRTVQCAFLPVFFPYCFLVYNDVWTVTFVLLALYWVLQGRNVWGALAIAVAVVMRQTTIFWVILLAALAAGDALAAARRPAGWPLLLRRTWPFVLVVALFGVFVLWNGGVAMGDRAITQVTFNPTNVWFYLFTFTLLFWPDTLCELWLFVRGKREPSPTSACPHVRFGWKPVCAISVLGLILVVTFGFPHIFNRINVDYVLHNIVLGAVTATPAGRLTAFAVIPVGLAGLLLTPLAEERFRWLIPISLMLPLGLPYIDPRYFVVPLTLFLLWRRPLSRPVEIGLTVYYVAFALWLNEVSFRILYFP